MTETGDRRAAWAARAQKELKGRDPEGLTEIDEEALRNAMIELESEHNRRTRHAIHLSVWCDAQLAKVQEHPTGQCTRCGAAHGDTDHLLWDCPSTHHQRWQSGRG